MLLLSTDARTVSRCLEDTVPPRASQQTLCPVHVNWSLGKATWERAASTQRQKEGGRVRGAP